ncbi:unnamed protein product [Ambrosiozyma monospora]|uniref:Unnamed protein product n=1 Tax=Ambrosiozyma monospora TaxID=43982 RepID=A0ACB5SUS2_AMBMO|nr:unnamed protein product [Ambrosiozyma monospora]
MVLTVLKQKKRVLKLYKSSISRLTIHDVPFDVSGCPNIESLTFSFYKVDEYCKASNNLENTTIQELSLTGLVFITIFQSGTPIEFKIPSSVHKLTLKWHRSVKEGKNVEDVQVKPYSVVLPSNLDTLNNYCVPVVFPNLHMANNVQDVCFFYHDCHCVASFIGSLPPSVQHLLLDLENRSNLPQLPPLKVSLSHLPNLKFFYYDGLVTP